MNEELISRRADVEKERFTLATQTGLVELLKGRMATREDSFSREQEDFEIGFAEDWSLPDTAATEMTARRERLKHEVDRHASGKGTLTVELKVDRPEMTGAQAKIGLLTGQPTTDRESAERTKRRLKIVRHALDGAGPKPN